MSVDNASSLLASDKASNASSEKLTQDSLSLQNEKFNLQKQNLVLAQLLKQKDRSTIISSIAGQVIYTADVKSGSNVAAYQSLVTVADPMQLQVKYTGDDVDSFAIGANVTVNYGGTDYPGKAVANQQTSASDTQSSTDGTNSSNKKYVQIKVDSLPKDAQIGSTVSVKLVLQKKDNVLIVPTIYLHKSEGKYYVNMLDKNQLRVQKFVEIGLQDQTQTEIVKGLSEGDSVIQ